MKKTALVVIDLQNDITKNYKKIIGQVNRAIDRAVENDIHVIYIRHYNLSEKTRTFKPDTKGSELVPELKVVSENIFGKSKASALTSEEFADFISKNGIEEFYITGADATGCVKSTSYNLVKAGYKVHVISDCVTSYNLNKVDEMLKYYADKGCEVLPLEECMME
ncbi:MAG: cysteine hydrolase [Lachnospiraceae bacterium]|nr:cysteine hydrolase [Lachnospiraceae bacterium]